MKTAMEIAMEVGATVELKKEAYGDSIGTSTAALTLLFPSGIPLDRYDEVLLIVRVWDKLQRAATGGDRRHECPWLDIAGYGIRGVEQHQRAQEIRYRWQGSVSGQDAEQSSKAQPDSAEQLTRTPTITSERSSAEPATLQQPESWSPQLTDVIASIAAGTASPSAVALLDRVRSRNSEANCGICTETRSHHWFTALAYSEQFRFCSVGCLEDFYTNLRAASLVVVA